MLGYHVFYVLDSSEIENAIGAKRPYSLSV